MAVNYPDNDQTWEELLLVGRWLVALETSQENLYPLDSAVPPRRSFIWSATQQSRCNVALSERV